MRSLLNSSPGLNASGFIVGCFVAVDSEMVGVVIFVLIPRGRLVDSFYLVGRIFDVDNVVLFCRLITTHMLSDVFV